MLSQLQTINLNGYKIRQTINMSNLQSPVNEHEKSTEFDLLNSTELKSNLDIFRNDTLAISSIEIGLANDSNVNGREFKDLRSLCESASVVESVNENVNGKSILQELLQKCGISVPSYQTSGPPNGPYESTIAISDLDIQFKGPAKTNKKSAEKSAAFDLLDFGEFKSKLDNFRNG